MATFTIDPAHTDVLFSAKHMMVTNVRGTFTEVSGSIELNETDPTASHAEIVLKAASIDTGFGARDTHLRSEDFFGVETYPEIRVMSRSVRATGGDDYVVTADVTIRDITKSVDFDVEFLGFYTGMDGSRRAGLSAKAKVNRKDWNLNWNVALEAGGWLVGDQIKLEVDLAIQQAVALAA
ncbi:MAG TPA: YceI family protein [Candidatus Limnocylindrales bacterium]|jgi:polyisoprenoid-binding protein YceI|nr:YceI family protein [Candidatus Limnocylindrales bacterium]